MSGAGGRPLLALAGTVQAKCSVSLQLRLKAKVKEMLPRPTSKTLSSLDTALKEASDFGLRVNPRKCHVVCECLTLHSP